MNLSKQQKHPQHTGRVLLGVDTPGPHEVSLLEMEGKKKLIWDKGMDIEFMTRVRGKAQQKAKELLTQAMEEATQLRQEAQEKGTAQGLAAGQKQLEEHLNNLSQSIAQATQDIQEQAEHIWAARKDDFIQLIQMSVKKTLGIEIEQRRQEILESLLKESLDKLETERAFTLHTAPQDVETLTELLAVAQKTNPKLASWNVKQDPSVSLGVILETTVSKVENTVDKRWQEVDSILSRLTVDSPEQQG